MTRRASIATALLWIGAGVIGGGCRSNERAGASVSLRGAPGGGESLAQGAPRQLVEVFSWWSAPGEAEALEALVNVHSKAQPEARIFNAAVSSGARAREILDLRLARHDPPDLFQENVHELRATVYKNAGRGQNLDALFDSLGLRQALFPEVLGEVMGGGHVLAMPVNLHRENALFYNRRIFAAHHLEPPTTVAEFLRVCETLQRAGVTAVATAHKGWILRIMFNSLAMGQMGGVRYRDYFTGKSPADTSGLPAAIDLFAEVMDRYTNSDGGEDGFSWTSAAQAVYNGDAAMFFHGDWVKGYLMQLGWRPDIDFGVVGAPGASDVFLYGIDTFVLPTGARNDVGARDFMTTVASPDGQVAFNRLKGSTPIRRDIDKGRLDAMGRATLTDLENAKIRMLVRSRPAWEDALAAFAKDRDRPALLRAFLDTPPNVP